MTAVGGPGRRGSLEYFVPVIVKCTKFGQLILVCRLEIPLVELTAIPQTSWLNFKGTKSKVGKGKGVERRAGKEGKEKERVMSGREWKAFPLL